MSKDSEEIDFVNHPPHYNFGSFEVLDVIEDWNLEYHEANAIKYIARAPHKGKRIEDLEKAVFYLNRKINKLKKEVSKNSRESVNKKGE